MNVCKCVSTLCSIVQQDVRTLTPREWLGFNWEVKTQNYLHFLAIHISKANPTEPSAWKKEGCGNNRPKQHRPDIETQTLQIECKCVRHVVCPSHLKENVFPRFKENDKLKVVVTNDKDLWTQRTREDLTRNKIQLWNHADLGDYCRNYLKTLSFTSIYNNIKRNFHTCTSVVKHIISNLQLTVCRLVKHSFSDGIFYRRKSSSQDFDQKKNDSLNEMVRPCIKTPKWISINHIVSRFLFSLFASLNFNSSLCGYTTQYEDVEIETLSLLEALFSV